MGIISIIVVFIKGKKMNTFIICLLSIVAVLFGAYYGFMVCVGIIASLAVNRKIIWSKVLKFPFGGNV